MTQLDILIMAAGKGTRMKSRIPKVLQRLAGRPLLHHVLDQAAHLQARSAIVITGHGATEVEAATAGAASAMGSFNLQFVRQEPQLGTGHAVQQAAPRLPDDGMAVVLSGDVPLTQPDTLRALVAASGGERLALLTVTLPDPTGYGRIVRNADGAVQAIVEHKDATEAQRAIAEVYSGIMAVPARLLKPWLARLTNDNAQGEYYLTDIVAMAVADGVPVAAHRITDALQVAGVNSPPQLAELERAQQQRTARSLHHIGLGGAHVHDQHLGRDQMLDSFERGFGGSHGNGYQHNVGAGNGQQGGWRFHINDAQLASAVGGGRRLAVTHHPFDQPSLLHGQGERASHEPAADQPQLFEHGDGSL